MARRWQVLAVVSMGLFMANLDLFIVNIAFPGIRRDFTGTSIASLSWILNAYAIAYAALLVPAGRLSDRSGRRRGFVGGLLLFTIASAACALAPSVGLLVGARVIQAAGAAFLVPTSLSLLLPEFPPAQRATAVGIWAAVGGVAAAFGPVIGGVLVEANWRLVFLVNVPIGIAAVVLTLRLVRESRDSVPGPRPDLVGALLLGAAIAGLALAVVQGPDWGWTSPAEAGCALAVAGILGTFVVRSTRHPVPVVDFSMLRIRAFAVASLASFFFSVGFAAMLLATILFLTGDWHYTVLRAGLAIVPGPLMAAVFSVAAGRLAARFPQRRLAALGGLLFASGCVLWAFRLTDTPNYLLTFLPSMLIGGIGVGLVLAPLASAAASSLPGARFATGIGVLTMARQVGSVLGVAVLVAVLKPTSLAGASAAFQHAWIAMAAASVAAAATALWVGSVGVAGLQTYAAATLPPGVAIEHAVAG